MEKIKPSKEQLKDLYINRRLTTLEIGKKYHLDKSTISKILKNYKIPIRNKSECKVFNKINFISKEQWEDLYINQRLSAEEVANKLNLSPPTVRKYLNFHEIEVRDQHESHMPKDIPKLTIEILKEMYITKDYTASQISEKLGISSRTVCRHIKKNNLSKSPIKPSKEQLEDLYNLYLSPRGVGKDLNVSSQTVRNWLNSYGIPLKYCVIQKTPKQIKQFLESHNDAYLVASLSEVTESTGDLAEILMDLYPNRFPSVSELAKALPSGFKKIGSALRPFSMSRMKEYYYELNNVPKEVHYKLEGILERVIFDNYLQEFNQKPYKVMNELKQYSTNQDGFSQLAQKVLNEYQSIVEFEIPGQGKLEDIV